ncbi:hypothetical protein [Streptococcus parauberis]|nr:hypothetical protein [Streptococcus parauberis]RFE01081.1 hypothetical protein ADO06_01954 [Streptococcus parauberis]
MNKNFKTADKAGITVNEAKTNFNLFRQFVQNQGVSKNRNKQPRP